jgi:two-component system NtrC family sensor kinase
MESTKSLSSELTKVTREVASYKIELDQTRKYLHCVLQNSTDIIFMTEITGLLVSFSKGAEKALGYAMEEVIGRPVRDLSEDAESFEALMAKSRLKGNVSAPEIHFRHKNGTRVHCHISLMELINREDNRVGTIGVCQDITRWKKLQEDLVQIDRLAEMGRIASGVAHEINNPLAIINEASGWAEEVITDAKGLNPDDREELKETVRKINLQTRRCRNITHKLLDFVRDSAPKRAEFDIHSLLKDTVDLLRPELKHTAIEVEFAFSQESLPITSDPRLLEQVFVNLVTNAIHAVLENGKGNGHIKIQTIRTDSGVDVSIEDNGGGIPEEARASIFTLFYTTKPPGKGTGLGLSICRNIVKNLGGELSYQSKIGAGTTFTISIPTPK